MRLANIRLREFRNHADTTLEFGEGTNVLIGDNGQGKTNILEAISYLCLTKSFYAASDSVTLMLGRSGFEIAGELVSDAGHQSNVRVAYVHPEGAKQYTINRRRIEPFFSVIGRFPLVILSPEHGPITAGGPAGRRRFVDMLLSQASRAYMEDLVEYRRILKQRNKILLEARFGRHGLDGLIEPWDEQFVKLAARLSARRMRFVREFQVDIAKIYERFVDTPEQPTIEYECSTSIPDLEDYDQIAQRFAEELGRVRRDELKYGATLVGPHRDEFIFAINGLNLRKFASQGQHKTFLIALKIAEFFYLKSQRGETPILLLDDVFGELDAHRARRTMVLLEELGQTVITSTARDVFDSSIVFGERHRKFFVTHGTVEHEVVAS